MFQTLGEDTHWQEVASISCRKDEWWGTQPSSCACHELLEHFIAAMGTTKWDCELLLGFGIWCSYIVWLAFWNGLLYISQSFLFDTAQRRACKACFITRLVRIGTLFHFLTKGSWNGWLCLARLLVAAKTWVVRTRLLQDTVPTSTSRPARVTFDVMVCEHRRCMPV